MRAVIQRQPAPARRSQRGRTERVLIALELVVGVTAVLGGVALMVQPDGSLLQAKLSVLSNTPFADWRIPGAFLATLVGGGSLLTAFWLWRHYWGARVIAVLSGLGILAFEVTEWVTLGFQPLEAVVGAVALLMTMLAWRLPVSDYDRDSD